ncbi:MAG: FtsX-like permease family protein [Candidatus Aminicenantes bacterium]|nr:FtsX-like permease family protein [Candidatus Aminicenantes bacterium]
MIAIFFRNLARDLVRQPLRTILTLSGVVWGTFSVVLLIALGESVGASQKKSFHGMGAGIVLLFPSRTTLPYQGFKSGKPVRITPEQAEDLMEKVPGIETLSPEFVWSRRIRYGKQEFMNTVRGVNPSFERIRNTIPAKGRFINPMDMAERRRVCFIGDVLATDLFGRDDPIGKQVLIEGLPFTVVGVMAKKEQNSNYNGQRDENCAFIPWTTFAALYGAKYVSNIILRPLDSGRSAAVTQDVKGHFSKLAGFDPKDPDAIFVWDTLEFEKQFSVFFAAFNVFLGAIGALTLLVGGVGVASIMMVVVEERTREIGIKLAVGARRRTILVQFFSETLMIMIIGGAVGFALAAGVIKLIQGIPSEEFAEFFGEPRLSALVVASTGLILLAIGAVSGYIPARNAASTNPIEALRK